MRLIRFLPAALIAILLVGQVTAQEGRRERGQRRPGQSDRQDRGGRGPRALPIISALDADADGEISAEEIEKAVAALKKLDENNDGKLTREEFMGRGGRFGGGQRGGRGGGAAGFIDRIFERDENGDGKLSKEEVPERMADRFGDMDGNGDGYISRDEFEEAFSATRQRGGGEGPGNRPPRRQRPE